MNQFTFSQLTVYLLWLLSTMYTADGIKELSDSISPIGAVIQLIMGLITIRVSKSLNQSNKNYAYIIQMRWVIG